MNLDPLIVYKLLLFLFHIANCQVTHMEISSPLAIESFSYSWLSNVETPLDGIDEHLRTSADSSSEAISKESAQNFNFDIPTSQSSAALLHADELFSDGLIKPVFTGPSKILDASTSGLITVLPGSSFSSRNVIPVFHGHYRLFSKWRISFKKNFLKCFGYLRTHCHNVGRSKKRSNRTDDIDRREWEVKSWSSSSQASPPPSAKYSAGVGDWCDIENSIYEAVLHCKRSIEK